MEQQLNYLDDSVLEELEEPHFREATDFFNSLVKAVKAKLVYPSSSKLPGQFMQDLAVKAGEIFKEIKSLNYKITSSAITYGSRTIYE